MYAKRSGILNGKQGGVNLDSFFDFGRIADALDSTPTAAYTAPHIYPNAAPMFQPCSGEEREQVDSSHLRLYVHIPFCNYACSYCCFAKKVGADIEQMQRYVRAVKKELEWVKPGTPVSQFFIGGGTPTALPAELLDEVLEAISDRMPYSGGGVHTVEASPDSITDEHLRVLKRRGVKRISMGIQSLREDILDTVRRAHPVSVLEVCERIMSEGFILNIDLMYGLPGQNGDNFREDFEIAARSGVHAVTAYSLRLNESTPIAKKLSESERFDLKRLMTWRALVRDVASSLGYTQTRWHTFKRMDTVAALHERLPTSDINLRGHQFGVGLTARSSLGYNVYRNHRGLMTYINRIESGLSPVEDVIRLETRQLKTLFITRTIGDGKALILDDYLDTFGCSIQDDHGKTIERLLKGGLVSIDDTTMVMTETGKLIHDLVTLSFYPDDAKKWLNEKLKNFQLDDDLEKMTSQ